MHFQVVTYIQNQAFGRNKTAFEQKEAGIQMLRYYWDGAGRQMMLGRARYVVAALAVSALVLLRKRARLNCRSIAGYMALVAITCATPTLTRLANPYLATR